MTRDETIRALWRDVAAQNEAMGDHFTADAVILWPNTGERFTVPEFVRANREYPGQWEAQVERIDPEGGFSVARVWSPEGAAFRAVSFYRWRGGKICRLEEYWGDVGPAPDWRRALGLGRPIREEDV